MSFLGSLFGGGGDKSQYDASNQQISQVLNQQSANSKFLQSTASPLITQGAQTLQAPLDYYNKLFSGDRTTASAALGPQLDVLKQNRQAQLNQVSQFAPRGGSRTSADAGSDTASDASLSNLLMSLKPAAADSLTSAGLNLANLGSSIFGGGSQINSTDLSTLLNQAQTASGRQQTQEGMSLNLINSLLSGAAKALGGSG